MPNLSIGGEVDKVLVFRLKKKRGLTLPLDQGRDEDRSQSNSLGEEKGQIADPVFVEMKKRWVCVSEKEKGRVSEPRRRIERKGGEYLFLFNRGKRGRKDLRYLRKGRGDRRERKSTKKSAVCRNPRTREETGLPPLYNPVRRKATGRSTSTQSTGKLSFCDMSEGKKRGGELLLLTIRSRGRERSVLEVQVSINSERKRIETHGASLILHFKIRERGGGGA